jgi:hypothetical protein
MDPKMIAVIAVALVVALWPQILAFAKKVKLPKVDEYNGYPSYNEAMIALAIVRERLVETGCLADDAHNAIEVVTHALVEGSDQ